MIRKIDSSEPGGEPWRKPMRKAITILLSGGYLFLATALAALFWRADAGWGAGAAALIAALGLFFSLHNLIARGIGVDQLKQELEGLRDAHGLLTDQLERTQAALDSLSDGLHRETESRAQALTSEVRMLEDLVARLGESLEDDLARGRGAGYSDPYNSYEARAVGLMHEVRQALEDNRVDLFLQPVVNLPQRRTVFYESFTRLRDPSGRMIMPVEYLSVAEPAGLMSAIDNLLLFRCVQIVRKLARQDRKVGIFCNISLASLGDETFFPQFLEFMAANRDIASSVIFELGQDAFEQRSALESRNMGKLARLGARFSLDKVTALDFDFADLNRAEVKFVKVGADLLLRQLTEDIDSRGSSTFRDLHAADYAALTRRYGVEVIAEKVERERQVVDVLELDVGFAQGHLFGEPRAIRDAFLSDPSPASERMDASPPQAAPRKTDRQRALGL